MGFPKKLLGQDETVVMLLRPHVKRLFLPVLLLLAVTPLATFAAGLVPDSSVQVWARGLIALAAVLVLLRWTVTPFVVWWNTVYVITNRRLVTRHGVFNRAGHDMPLSRLNDVSFSHNLFERIIGCGTLTVESAGERGQLVLSDVPKVERVQRVLYRLSDEARQSAAPSGSYVRGGELADIIDEANGEDDDRQDDDRQDDDRQDDDRQADDRQADAGRGGGDGGRGGGRGGGPDDGGGPARRWGRRTR
jgi:uncharacterized membrane protein YdbT with pleckstrin-like domain